MGAWQDFFNEAGTMMSYGEVATHFEMGTAYAGNAVFTNEHYTSGIAKTIGISESFSGYWTPTVRSITVVPASAASGSNHSVKVFGNLQEEVCDANGGNHCYIDSGTPPLVLPNDILDYCSQVGEG